MIIIRSLNKSNLIYTKATSKNIFFTTSSSSHQFRLQQQ